jgi:hypothetical protein
MIFNQDVQEAVDRGILTAEQAAALTKLATDRRKARAAFVNSEERFRLLGGFNDIFIALGVALFVFGLVVASNLFLPTFAAGADGALTPGMAIALWWTVAAAAIWGIAEFLTARLKLTVPSILLVCAWSGFTGSAALSWFSLVGVRGDALFAAAGLAMVSAIAIYFERFRLPFALLALGVAGLLMTQALIALGAVNIAGVSRADAWSASRWVSLVYGLAVFGAAMSYDLSDPRRLTRRADSGFWLHLLAAPLIVHPIAAPLINHPLFPDYSANAPQVTGITVAIVLLFTLLLATVALVVDRRALLVAGLGYLGGATTYAVTKVAAGNVELSIIVTLIFLGLGIISLGVGWRNIRRYVMRRLPYFTLKDRLPPYERSS